MVTRTVDIIAFLKKHLTQNEETIETLKSFELRHPNYIQHRETLIELLERTIEEQREFLKKIRKIQQQSVERRKQETRDIA